MTRPKGTCSGCGRERGVTAVGGVIWRHLPERGMPQTMRYGVYPQCAGSGLPPVESKQQVELSLTYAEARTVIALLESCDDADTPIKQETMLIARRLHVAVDRARKHEAEEFSMRGTTTHIVKEPR